MTPEEITAKEIGLALYGARTNLIEARRLIDGNVHSIAWANTELALRETEQAIKMMKQDYVNFAKCVDGCGHQRIHHIVSQETLEGYCSYTNCACTRFDNFAIEYAGSVKQ